MAGAIWAISFVLLVSSIDTIGLSRSNQWKNLQGPIGVVLSLIILREFSITNPYFVILAAVAIFLSALFFTISSGKNRASDMKGVYLAVLSAIGFGSVAVIQKYVTTNVGVYSQQVIWSLSIVGSLFVYILYSKKIKKVIEVKKRDAYLGLGAGVLYLGASFFQLFSYKYLAASISFTIIQMNTFWTIAIGILIFKEINLRKYYKRVSLGFLFTLVGILFLVYAKI